MALLEQIVEENTVFKINEIYWPLKLHSLNFKASNT